MAAVPHVEVRGQLERIVGSGSFARAPRLRRFLIYVVEEALGGRADRLKEYTLGVEVFDRGEGFDPRSDPIVRVDARRLRARLERYYDEEGAADSVEIGFARGSYVPRFRRRKPDARPAPVARAEPIRIAVLPFQATGGGVEEAAFAEGLGDELALALARRPELRVVGRTSSAWYREEPRDLAEIGRRLDVRLVLLGKLRRDGVRWRVSVSLLSVGDGSLLWSENHDATVAGAEQVFALQDRIAQQIAERLTPRVRELADLRPKPPTGDIAAYELYLRGRHQYQSLNPAVLAQTAAFLEAAIARDPAFALAHAALADVQFARAVFLLEPPVTAMRRSRELARAALALDPGLAGAHARLAVLSAVLDHDFAQAADGFARALSLDPSSADARHDRACWFLTPLGRLEEAAAEFADLLGRDPFALRLRVHFARVLLCQRRHDEAIAQLTLVLDMDPRYGVAMHYLAFAHEYRGDLARARSTFERQLQLFPYPLSAPWFEAACAIWDGKPARARQIVRRMEAEAADGVAAATVIADLHRRLGDRGRAIDWLERAAEQRLFRVVYLKVEPDYDELRPEPRFQALLRRVGLEG